jgi:phosphoglycerate dehydrogenase-like enzyme
MKVLIDMPVYEPLFQSLKNIEGITVSVVEKPEEKLRPLPVELIRDCGILLCTFPPENHQEMNDLKLIQLSSAGYKQVVGQKFEDRNIRACNALGVFDVPIAEWNIAMMVNLARDMRSLVRNQESATWDRSARFQKEIRGSVVGIWGYGGIGRETARLAKAMGMKVHVLSRNGVSARENIYCVPGTGDPEGILPDKVFLMNEKKAFFKDLDFLIMAIPQTGTTEGIMDEEEFRMLDPKVFLLNPARGPLIREDALLKALREGWISGAALDTHYHYPMPAEHPLWSMPNVIMTPHISGSSSSPRFLERVWDIFIQNVQRYMNGESLLNELTKEQLAGS